MAGTKGLTVPRIDRTKNHQSAVMPSPTDRMQCQTDEWPGTNRLCYQNNASASSMPLMMVLFRPVLGLGCTFGNIQTSTFSLPMGLSIPCVTAAPNLMDYMLAAGSLSVHLMPDAKGQSFTVSKPALFPFAFRRGLLALSDGQPEFSRWLCGPASLGKSVCFCPFAPDGRVVIERPGNGPRSIAVRSTTVPVDNRWRWSGPGGVYGRIGGTTIQVTIQSPAASRPLFMPSMPVNNTEQARPMPRPGSKKFQAKNNK
jgi:hypothetical protein